MTDQKALDAAFRAWVETLPNTHWAKYDLSACRLGWDAALAAWNRRAPIAHPLHKAPPHD